MNVWVCKNLCILVYLLNKSEWGFLGRVGSYNLPIMSRVSDIGRRPLVSVRVFMHVKASSIHVWLSEGTNTLTDVWHMQVSRAVGSADGWPVAPIRVAGRTGALAFESRPRGCYGKRRWLYPVGGLLASSVPFMYISLTVQTTDKWACSWWAPRDT